MEIQRDNISETKVKLTISIGKSELADGESVALTKLARDVKAPGFRKGKVPLSVAKKHISPVQLAEEAVDNAISKAVAEAFSTSGIRALERPQVEVTEYEPGDKLVFTAEAEVIPEIKLGDYKKLKSPKQEPVKISDQDVESVIDRIKSQLATKEDVERPAQTGDEVIIDFVGKKDGQAFDGGTGNDYPLTLGSNSFIPGFEDALVGVKAGDKKDVELTFPDDYHVKNLAGQPVVFEVTVKSVKGISQPEENDELAAKAGPFTTMQELRDDIRRELSTQKEREQSEQRNDQLVRQLVDKSKVSAPQVLIDDQIRHIEQDMTQNLMYQGMTFDQWLASQDYADREAWLEKEARPVAEERVKAGLVLSELSKVENITATDQELAERLGRLQEQYANSPEAIKQLATPEVQRDMANQLITEKTIQRLVELNSK